MALQRDQPSASTRCSRSSREKGAVRAQAGRPRPDPESCGGRLGPGLGHAGRLGRRCVRRCFRGELGGTSNKNGGTVPCAIKVMRDVDMESGDLPEVCEGTKVLRRLREAPRSSVVVWLLDTSDRSSRHRRDLYLWFEACVVDFRQLTKMECYMTLPDARSLTRELITAMRHIHSKDVIHRDIKPANLLLHGSGTLKFATAWPASRRASGRPCRIRRRRRPQNLQSVCCRPPTTSRRSRATSTSSTWRRARPGAVLLYKRRTSTPAMGEADEETTGAQTPTVGQRPEMRRTYTEHVVTRWYRSPRSWCCYNRMALRSTSGLVLASLRSVFWALVKKSWSIGKAEGCLFPGEIMLSLITSSRWARRLAPEERPVASHLSSERDADARGD